MSDNIDKLRQFFKEKGFNLPNDYGWIFGHPEWLPPSQRNTVFTQVKEVVSENESYRRRGWFTSEGWPEQFIAIGNMDGDAIYLDLRRGADEVWLADHETSATFADPDKCRNLKKIADSFGEFIGGLWHAHFLNLKRRPPISNPTEEDLSFSLAELQSNLDDESLRKYFMAEVIKYGWLHRDLTPADDHAFMFSLINLSSEQQSILFPKAVAMANRQQDPKILRAAISLCWMLTLNSNLTVQDDVRSELFDVISRARPFVPNDLQSFIALEELSHGT